MILTTNEIESEIFQKAFPAAFAETAAISKARKHEKREFRWSFV